ncbi:hypothetical protein [Actomonas aquatica]|uniref:Uncharacterized protein n=1 Tax=Actomonas aquatica TaxID=2866162 RepID=A0ABZ1CEK9_9BACT|nr:hypothetical protein [Opitutus sp. WL0086]WRQ89049.1 hypothetical protein K1X11_006490 [Opitutus sp. WL0086]
MKDDSTAELREAGKIWLCLIFSVMWIGLGVAGFAFVLNSQYFGRIPLASLGAIVLSGFILLKGGYMFVRSLIALFRP